MTKTSFGDQLQQMWQTRPVRLPRQGPIAGVAAGFGQRYNIDPVLIRVALVVSTIFGGAGVVLYLLGWLLLNAAGDQASAAESLVGRGQSSQSQTKTIVLIVALAIAVSTMGPAGVGLAGSGLISMALMLAGWWMLHMRSPQPPPGTSEFDVVDGGLTATGYPGAVFPQQGSPLRTTGEFYAPDMPPMNVYSPYTKLPDAYVPDNPVPDVPQGDAVQPRSGDAVLLDKGEDATEVLDADRGTAETLGANTTQVLGKKGAGTADGGPVLGKDDTATKALGKEATPGVSGTVAPSLDKAGPDTAGTTTAATQAATGAMSPHPAAGTTDSGPSPSLDKSGPNTSGDSTGESTSSTASSRSTSVSAPVQPSPLGTVTPPSWDPLGVAPLAWDLPEPAPVRTIVEPDPKRPRSRLTPVVLGLAILAAAGAGALAAAGVEWMTPGRIAAVALAVIGLGLVLGAFLRRGFGLLVLTAPLAGFVVLASLVGPVEFDSATVGDRTWAPAAMADLAPTYELTMGTGTLDLRSLNLTENRAVEVSVQLGEATVLLPQGMRVHTDCAVNMGDVKCPDGTTGPDNAPVLDLKVNVRAGSAEVRRG